MPAAKRRRRDLTTAALAAAVGCGALWLGGRLVAVAVAPTGIPAHTVSVNPITGRATVRNLQLPLGEGVIVRIGAVTFDSWIALVPPAHAAVNLEIKNLTVDTSGLLFRVPSVAIVGSSLDQKAFAELQTADTTRRLADMMAGFSATSISVPEVSFDRAAGSSKQTTTLRNVALRQIASGKAATISSTGGTIKGPAPVDITLGASAGQGLDLALLARRLSETTPPEKEAGVVLQSLAVENVAFKGANGEAVAVKRVASTGALLQPGVRPQHPLSAFGQIKATDATIDIPARPGRSAASRWTLRELTLVAEAPSEGLPTRYRLGIDNLSTPLSASGSDPTSQNLTGLGLTELRFSGLAEADWRPQSAELDVKKVTIDVVNVGAIEFGGLLGQFKREVFYDTTAPLKDVTVRTIDLKIENKGLYERVVMREAKKRGKSIEQMQSELRTATVLYMSTILAKVNDAGPVLQAVAKFAEKPGRLVINAKAKDRAGVPLGEVGKATPPAGGVTSRFDVAARAE